jgi:hypothetical protein
MSSLIEVVTLHWPGEGQFLVEFGSPAGTPQRTSGADEPDRHIYRFTVGSLVGYTRRLENRYGTVKWSYFALLVGNGPTVVPGVSAPSDLLWHLEGKARFNRARRWVARLHGAGIDPAALSPSTMRRAGLRLEAGVTLEPILRSLLEESST